MQQHWQRLSSGAIGVIGDTIDTNLEVQELTPVSELINMLDDVTRHCLLALQNPNPHASTSYPNNIKSTKDTSPADFRQSNLAKNSPLGGANDPYCTE